MATIFEPTDLSNLDVDKLRCLERTLASILATAVAEDIFAQIIDGRPTRPSFIKNYGYTVDDSTISDKTEPSEESTQLFQEIRAGFTPQILLLEIKLVQAYQSSQIDSLEHKLRLLEITAASVHTLAGAIYAAFHPETNIKPASTAPNLPFYGTQNWYVDFYHKSYWAHYTKYPFGILNVIGYWAETQIFGGVLLFERSVSGLENMSAFVHPQKVHYAFQLSEQQIDNFWKLGENDSTGSLPEKEQALPFYQLPGARIAGGLEMQTENIYKNEYDRMSPPRMPHVRCVRMDQKEVALFREAARRMKLDPSDPDVLPFAKGTTLKQADSEQDTKFSENKNS